ncbi:MAG TPA: Hsp20/alpha crystallin family protein [Chloroflexota bacterium]|nr:Hsp20/alpha crystallin family protein [Chloroflexota bacterium]
MVRLPIARKNHRQSVAAARRSGGEVVPLRQMLSRLFDESFLMPSLLDEMFPASSDGSNLYEAGDSYIVQLAMPGVKPNSISCTVEGNVLTCTSESAVQAPEKATPIWESIGGQNEYQIQLPTEVDAANAHANYEHGILTITLPKVAHARAQAIKVTTK